MTDFTILKQNLRPALASVLTDEKLINSLHRSIVRRSRQEKSFQGGNYLVIPLKEIRKIIDAKEVAPADQLMRKIAEYSTYVPMPQTADEWETYNKLTPQLTIAQQRLREIITEILEQGSVMEKSELADKIMTAAVKENTWHSRVQIKYVEESNWEGTMENPCRYTDEWGNTY